jgi:MFS family permease
MITWHGVTATAMFSVVNSGFLAAYALVLGANNFQIGILASIPFLMQPFQIPTIVLVERLRLRKFIALSMWFPAQIVWLVIALIPLLVHVPSGAAVGLLMGLMGLRGVFTAIMSTSWNSWLRDMVPRDNMGQYFSRRLAYSTVGSIVFALAGAAFVDWWRGYANVGDQVFGYTFVLVFGFVFLGLTSAITMVPIAEPRMPETMGRVSIGTMLMQPLRDKNYTHLMRFLMLWGFASTLAIPFFAVYMLTRLGLPVSMVIGFNVLSQVFNVLFLRVWGTFADRYGYKGIISLSASLYLMVILGWVFTTMPERYFLTIPLLIVLHIFAGIASAGVNLGVETIGLKLAPEGMATPYLVGASLSTSIGAALGPIVGGRFADFFSVRELSLTLRWDGPNYVGELPAVIFTGHDFLFGISFLLGLLTLNLLAALKEEGEVSRDVILEELQAQTRGMTRSMSMVPGIGMVSGVPYGALRHIPGMDVAASVAAYQLVSSVQSAVATAMRGRALTADVASRVRHAIIEAAEQVEDWGEHGIEFARHATRGVMLATKDAGVGLEHLAKGTVRAALETSELSGADAKDVFRGVGYGTVEGAAEAGANVSEATERAMEAIRLAAQEIGFPEKEALAVAAQGAIDAAEAIRPSMAADVKGTVVEHLLSEYSQPDDAAQPVDEEPDENGPSSGPRLE